MNLLISLLASLVTSFLTVNKIPVNAQSPVATSSSDFETIKENVKKRIQDVVKDKVEGTITKEKIAFIGTLKSRTSNTLSIQTNSTIKLASISGSTKVERNPTISPFGLDDIALDDYLVALGYNGDDEVLDARKIIVEKNPPGSTKYQVIFGKVISYSTKDYTLVIENQPDSNPKTYLVSRKATIKQAYANDVYDLIPRNKPVPVDASALIIYLPAETEADDAVAYQVILKTNPISSKDSPTNAITPTP